MKELKGLHRSDLGEEVDSGAGNLPVMVGFLIRSTLSADAVQPTHSCSCCTAGVAQLASQPTPDSGISLTFTILTAASHTGRDRSHTMAIGSMILRWGLNAIMSTDLWSFRKEPPPWSDSHLRSRSIHSRALNRPRERPPRYFRSFSQTEFVRACKPHP